MSELASEQFRVASEVAASLLAIISNVFYVNLLCSGFSIGLGSTHFNAVWRSIPTAHDDLADMAACSAAKQLLRKNMKKVISDILPDEQYRKSVAVIEKVFLFLHVIDLLATLLCC